MNDNSVPVAPRYEAIGFTTSAPPIGVDELPRSTSDWRRRSGLTDPAVISARAHLRSGGSPVGNPLDTDFFRS